MVPDCYMQEADKMRDVLQRLHRDMVTIFNKVTDTLYEWEAWYPTVIEHVRMDIDQQENIAKTGLKDADRCSLTIPFSSPEKRFVPPKVFETMTDSEKKQHWTLKKDDFFVRGDLSDIPLESKNLFEWASKTYGEYNVFRITSIGDLTGTCLPKWKVGGK